MADLLREKHRARGTHRAQIGGGSSTRSESATTNTDSRISQQSGLAVSGNSNTLNVLDANAVNRAFDFGTTTVAESFGFATRSNAQALDSLNTTSNLVKDAYSDAKGRGVLTDKIMIGSIAMAGLVAVMALRK